jgi:hypothetical protein
LIAHMLAHMPIAHMLTFADVGIRRHTSALMLRN